jgi:hypothetical protein
LTTVNPVYLISTKAHGRCDRSAEDAYTSATPDPTFAVVGGLCCPILDFEFAFWIMITFDTLLTLLSCIVSSVTICIRILCQYCSRDDSGGSRRVHYSVYGLVLLLLSKKARDTRREAHLD